MKAIIFDYDGVIMDTFWLTKKIYEEVNEHFKLNLPQEIGFYRDLFELDYTQTLKKLNLHTQEEWDIVEDIFRRGLEKHQAMIKPYPGIVKVLDFLSGGYTLGIVTNNLKSAVVAGLKGWGIDQHFQAVLASEDGELKPSPDLVLKCMSRLGVNPDETAFIGDMDGDIQSARTAGVKKVVAVTYGYHLKHKLMDADVIVNTPEALTKLF